MQEKALGMTYERELGDKVNELIRAFNALEQNNL